MNYDAEHAHGILEMFGSARANQGKEKDYREFIQAQALISIAESLQKFAFISENISSVLNELAEIADEISAALQGSVAVESGDAVSAQLTLGGNMSTSTPGTGEITVDTVNGNVEVTFYDDKGDVTAAPTGTVVTFASDTESVLTVANDSTNPLQGDLTPVAIGTANISATISGATAPDGSAFTVSPIAVNVVAGPAATAGLALEVPSAAPVDPTQSTDTPSS
jgi:hypothetical protein